MRVGCLFRGAFLSALLLLAALCVLCFSPACASAEEQGIPSVYLEGELPKDKNIKVMKYTYVSDAQNYSGYCEIKCQGDSSLRYAKKNFTIETFTDAECTNKLKTEFSDWGKHNKYCYKANWIDYTHARNIVSARLWGKMLESRGNYDALPEGLKSSPNHGAIDGFAIKMYVNGVYYGRYTINIPKAKWAFGMEKIDTNCVIQSLNYYSGCFRQLPPFNGFDWSDELHDTMPENIKTRWTEVTDFVMNASDEDFTAHIDEYIDRQSLIDYYIFAVVSCGVDSMGKNQFYMTYDGLKWYISVYDMDSTWGLDPNAIALYPADYPRVLYEDYKAGRKGNYLFERLLRCFGGEVYERYLSMRQTTLSYESITGEFESFISSYPAELLEADKVFWSDKGEYINSALVETATIDVLKEFISARLHYCDGYFKEIYDGRIPCTSINIEKSDALVYGNAPLELTVITAPTDTTDSLIWESSNPAVAAVENGAVIAHIGNASCTITVRCGDYSDSCAVQTAETGALMPKVYTEAKTDMIGGSAKNCVAYTLEKTVFVEGTQPVDTGFKPFQSADSEWTISITYSSYGLRTDHFSDLISWYDNAFVLKLHAGWWKPYDFQVQIEDNSSYTFHKDWGYANVSIDAEAPSHTITLVKKGSVLEYYIDGQYTGGNDEPNRVYTYSFMDGDENLFLGASAVGAHPLLATIYDFRIYDSAFTAGEVAELVKTLVKK